MPFWRTRILMMFYRELAQMVGSGVPIVEAMGILADQPGDPAIQRVAGIIRDSLAQGNTLADGFAESPDLFPLLHVNIMKYGETAGRPAECLASLAGYMEKEYAMQQTIMVGLAYPVLLLHAAMFLLPIVNAVTCGLGGYLRGFLGVFIPVYGIVFLIFAATRMQRNEQFKNGMDAFVVSLPVIGRIVRQFAITRFIRALQIMSASGVPIITAWQMAVEACGNNAVRTALLTGSDFLERGEGLSRAFRGSGVFTPQMISMITTAERSGSIVQTLNTIAVYSERENETAIGMLTRIVPVIVYILVAGFIALRVISFYIGYFNRIFSVG
jgi:type IV pilus assembly protein PilC